MLYNLLTLFITSPIINNFARGGGGGSSSGDSGGGIIILIGYLPMHAIGALLRRFIPVWVASLIGWPIAVIYAIFWFGISFGDDSDISAFGIIVAFAALVGMGAGLYNWFNKIAKLSIAAKKNRLKH